MDRLLLFFTVFLCASLIFNSSDHVYAQQAKGPILRIQNNPTDFDTTFCMTTKCRTLMFSNVGDTVLRVTSIDNILSPFSGTIPVPFTLQKNESRSFQICYRPLTAPRIDSQRVQLIADTRLSLSVGLLFDVSGSMTTVDVYDPVTATNVTRISAAHDAGIDFIQGLLNNPPDVVDEAAVFQFAAPTDYSTLQSFTTNKTFLTNAVPSTAPGASTCLYDAIINTVNNMNARPNRKVMILLTDGNNNCGGSTTSLQNSVNAAIAAGITVFTIGLGDADSTALKNIASGTNGRFFWTNNRTDLIAVYRHIATLLSQNVQVSFLLRGRSVSPFMIVNPSSLDFDSVKVGQSRCLPVTIRNTGDAPLTVSNIANVITPFSFQVPPNISQLAPGNQTTVNVCFTPVRLRVQTGAFAFSHNSCTQPVLQLNLRGVGYDSVYVALVDTFRAKPGSTIYVPVYFRSKLPSTYDVTSLSLSLTYNKTMLYPMTPQPIITQNTLSSVMSTSSYSPLFDVSAATTTFNLSGNTLSNPINDSLLVKLGFLVLHGNALTTSINLSAATFADGNPRVGRIQPGLLIADSLCYQDQRLIDASARIANKLTQNIPNPFSVGSFGNPTTTIGYSIAEPAWTRLIVYNSLGQEIIRLVDQWKNAGEYEVTFDASKQTSGVYFYRIDAGAFTDMKKMFLAK